MREWRVVFVLTNGKKKYATHDGEILLFEKLDLDALFTNFEKYERFVFTEDLQDFDFTIEELKKRHPYERRFVRVKNIVLEDPLTPEKKTTLK